MARTSKISELLKWFQREKPILENLAHTADGILQNLLKKHKISIVSVTSRVKSADSLTEKQRRKRYKDPVGEITDFVGLRVITYTEDDANRVCEIVKRSFEVDSNQSTDKGKQLEVNQIGYRSHHFICDLGEKRIALPESEAFKGKKFEIQVRTILQHAWAEVEHDRNYKFSGILPTALQRRLFLISGVLEVGDRELNQLSRDIDAYAISIAEKAREGKLKDEELNSASLPLIVAELVKGLAKAKVTTARKEFVAVVVEECRAFGVNSASGLKALFNQDFLQALDTLEVETNEVGATRDAMMYADIKHYFEVAWQKHWGAIVPDSFALLSAKYGNESLLLILNENNVEVLGYDPDDLYDHEVG